MPPAHISLQGITDSSLDPGVGIVGKLLGVAIPVFQTTHKRMVGGIAVNVRIGGMEFAVALPGIIDKGINIGQDFAGVRFRYTGRRMCYTYRHGSFPLTRNGLRGGMALSLSRFGRHPFTLLSV